MPLTKSPGYATCADQANSDQLRAKISRRYRS